MDGDTLRDAQQILYGRFPTCCQAKAAVSSRVPGAWVDKIDPRQLFLGEVFENRLGGFSGGSERWLAASPDLMRVWLSYTDAVAEIAAADVHVLTVQQEYLETFQADADEDRHFTRFDHQVIDDDLLRILPCDSEGMPILQLPRSLSELYVNRHQLQAIEILVDTVGEWSFYHHSCEHADDCNYTELVYRELETGRLLGSASVGERKLVAWNDPRR